MIKPENIRSLRLVQQKRDTGRYGNKSLCACIKHKINSCTDSFLKRGDVVFLARHRVYTTPEGQVWYKTERWRPNCLTTALTQSAENFQLEAKPLEPKAVSPYARSLEDRIRIYTKRLAEYLKDPNANPRRKTAIKNCEEKIRLWTSWLEETLRLEGVSEDRVQVPELPEIDLNKGLDINDPKNFNMKNLPPTESKLWELPYAELERLLSE